ncbi:hypothetical protein PV797_02675 [Clostridiaceae bacterium M8S5]|nr:hypothetical protein PV797_02675 [Clostridiaceae bacterium M8S5]
MKEKISKIISITLIMCLLMVSNVSATQLNNVSKLNLNGLSSEEINFLKAYQRILGEFEFDKTGKLVLKLSLSEIKEKYEFTDGQISKLKEVMQFADSMGPVSQKDEPHNKNDIFCRIHFEGSKVYFTNEDIVTFLLAAAEIGPAAIYAALVGLGSTLGPVGTGIVAVVGILGMPSLATFTYQVIQAHYAGKGVYIGVEWNGFFPNIVSGVW